MSGGPYPTSLERFETLRQSRLAAFDRCALSAYFDEEYGWFGSHRQAGGQIAHACVAKILAAMYSTDSDTIPTGEAVAILDETIRQADMEELVNLPMEEIKNLRWVIVKFATDNQFEIKRLIDIEQRLGAEVRYPNEDGSYTTRILTGQLDALFVVGAELDEAIVIDWKDTWGMPGPTDVGFDGYFQQRFYALLVFRNYPMINKVTLREHYLRYSEYREAVVWRADAEDIEAELAALAERYDRAFAEEQFPPTPGAHCSSMCARPGACPIVAAARQEGMIEDEKTAKQVAAELTVAEAVAKGRRKALSAWTSVHGSQEVSHHKGTRGWGHREQKRTKKPTPEQVKAEIAAAERMGITPDIDKLYVTTTGTRFDQHILSEPEPSADDAKLMATLEESVKQGKAKEKGQPELLTDPGDPPF